MRKFAFLAVAAAAFAFAAPSKARAQVVIGIGGSPNYGGYSPYGYGGTGLYDGTPGIIRSGFGNYGYSSSYYGRAGSRYGTGRTFNSTPRMTYSQRNNYYNYYNRGYHGTGYGGRRR